MIKKGQVSIIYFSFLVLFSVVFLFAIYTLSTNIIETSTNELSDYQIDNIVARVKANLVEMKAVVDMYNITVTNISRTLSIPDRIGANEYLIRGNGTDIIFQTFGSNSRLKRIPVYWWDTSLEGQVLSTNSKIDLTFYNSSNKVRIS